MQRRDVLIQAFHRRDEDVFVQLRRRQGFIKTRPASVPRLELGPRQVRLHLHHALAEIVKGALVGIGLAFEMQPDLEPPRPGVVPHLEVELGMAVMELEKSAVSAARFECLEVLWQLWPGALAQSGEELDRSHRRRAYQRLRIYLVK